MQAQIMRRMGLGIVVLAWTLVAALLPLSAAPYAAMVMDARNGEVIHARNHDTKLHPASLTKMMTLYLAFEAVKHGEVGLDTKFKVSRRATLAECVCLGLREGQRISLRHLIRAAALRSANDAAVVIAEGISGSVEAFCRPHDPHRPRDGYAQHHLQKPAWPDASWPRLDRAGHDHSGAAVVLRLSAIFQHLLAPFGFCGRGQCAQHQPPVSGRL